MLEKILKHICLMLYFLLICAIGEKKYVGLRRYLRKNNLSLLMNLPFIDGHKTKIQHNNANLL